MATLSFLGLRGVIPATAIFTVASPTAADIFKLTTNGKVISYVVQSGDTTTTVAAALAAAAAASSEPEWGELTVTAAVAVVTIAGPTTGAPFTATSSVAGTGTLTAGATTAAVSPNDVGDGFNYSTGALPNNSDTLVFPAGAADAMFSLNALAAITGLTIIREINGPAIGLPDWRAANYREYRPTRLKVPATTLTLNMGQADRAGEIRLDLNSATSAVRIFGTNSFGLLGQEQVDLIGAASTSTVQVNNASVSVGLPTGTATPGTLATITGDSATVNVGGGVTVTNLELNSCVSQIACNWTNLTVDGNGTTNVVGSATGATTTNLNGGTTNWNGSGALNVPILGPGAILDLSGGSAPVAVTTRITKNAGSIINDPGSRITVPYGVDCYRSGADGLAVGRHLRLTIDAAP